MASDRSKSTVDYLLGSVAVSEAESIIQVGEENFIPPYQSGDEGHFLERKAEK